MRKILKDEFEAFLAQETELKHTTKEDVSEKLSPPPKKRMPKLRRIE